MADKSVKGRMIAAGFYRPGGTKQWLHKDGFGVQKVYWHGHATYVAVDYLTQTAAGFRRHDEACEKVLEYVAERKEASNGSSNSAGDAC